MLHSTCFFYLRYVIFFLIVVFLYGIYHRSKLWRTENYWIEAIQNFPSRLSLFVKFVLLQRGVLKRKYAAVMHTAMLLGIALIIIVPVILDINIYLIQSPNLAWIRGSYASLELLLDIAGILILAGVALALFRRLYIKPASLETGKGDLLVPSFLVSVAVTGFLLEGLRLAGGLSPYAGWSIVGFIFSKAVAGLQFTNPDLTMIYWVFIWIHASLILLLLVLVPYTNLRHAVVSSLNIFFSSLKPRGELTTPFELKKLLESEDFEIKIGTDRVDDFKWKQRLSLDACVNCGRCQDVCPAYTAGRPLSPKNIIQKLKKQMIAEHKAKEKTGSLFSEIIGEDEVWACTTCYGCPESCPVLIDQLTFIVDFRRFLTSESRLDKTKNQVLGNFADKSNPYGLPSMDRANWTKGLPVKTLKEDPNPEYLYWIGCVSSYDSRNQNVAKSMVKILNKAAVSYGILGAEEKCCGETLRRMGDEGRFQQLALENIEILKKYGVKKIIVHCPHGYNTLRNEYPKLGGKFEVISHTEFLSHLIMQRKIAIPKKISEEAVFHDPCYLGRYNGIYEAPRRVLGSAVSKITELPRSRETSFCCGGGGGNAWYEVPEKERISVIRLREVEQAGAKLLAAACPYCISMFEDALRIRSLEGKIKVKDISEVIAELIDI